VTRKESEADNTWALKEILKATAAIEAALASLDMDAFELALAARDDVLTELGAATAGADGALGHPSHASLAEEVLASDVRARETAARAMEGLRRQVRELAAAHQGLTGYRGSSLNLPRFADRKG
jgi:hypothetical protein